MKFRWLRSSIAAGLILSLAFVGNAQETTPAPAELPELCPQGLAQVADDAPVVLTTFTVLADMASHVACNHLRVQSLTRPGAEIHHYEPTPSDLVNAQTASLVLYNGFNLELWFKQFMGAVSDVPSVELTEGLQPLMIAEGAYKDQPNPHAWMSPTAALTYVENIRLALTDLDPANAAAYQANADAYIANINAIGDFLRDSLAQLPPQQRTLVSCEGAFSYLARDYNMNQFYLWAVNADQQGTPRQVQAVIEAVRANAVPAVFCETTVNPSAMETVAYDTGAVFGGSLFVDSLSEPDGPAPTYLELLRQDANTIVNGLLRK